MTQSTENTKRKFGKKGWIIGGITALVILAVAGGGRHHRSFDSANIEQKAESIAERIADKVDATPEQTAQLKLIAKTASADVAPVRAQMTESKAKLEQLLAAPTVDRVALEQLRVAQVQQMDAVSQRMVGSLADGLEVLTPEQRAKLNKHWWN